MLAGGLHARKHGTRVRGAAYVRMCMRMRAICYRVKIDSNAHRQPPRAGLGAALDRRDGHRPTFVLPDRPEFLFDEEASVHTRSWSENLTYYTGVGYLSGALLGGARGGYGALSTPLAVTAGADSSRLRVNALLNGSGRAGRTSGNALGALGLFFASFESFAHYLNSDGWVPEEVPTLAAGAFSGAIYRSPRGPRQAAAAGAIGLAAATALLGARTFISRGL